MGRIGGVPAQEPLKGPETQKPDPGAQSPVSGCRGRN